MTLPRDKQLTTAHFLTRSKEYRQCFEICWDLPWTTPLVYLDEERIGGADDPESHLGRQGLKSL